MQAQPLSDPHPDSLLVDFYELTMAASYFAHGMNGDATFELFVRRLPPERNFLIACGLDDALDYLEGFALDEPSIEYLRSLEVFTRDFLDFLGALRFTGDVWAMPEGEAAFAGEPLMRVTAPLIEAQVVETFLLNCIAFQTGIASKAARVAIACGGRPFVDFSARRDHGADAAVKAARAAYVSGASATSNVLAGRLFGIPLSGTMAHSYVMSFEHEIEAFRTFAHDFPERSILLIDTYDTLHGARLAAIVAAELAQEGRTLQGVRLDSGDIERLAKEVRAVLDGAGFPGVQVFASGDLDEYRIRDLLAAGAPVDAFGVGTRMGTAADAPALSAVYKLVESPAGPRAKLSPGKETLPGRKQVYRVVGGGRYAHDVLALDGEAVSGRPLLGHVMSGGLRVASSPSLSSIRGRCAETLASLPERLLAFEPAWPHYEVRVSPQLEALRARLSPR